jgi:hypothetical protein
MKIPIMTSDNEEILLEGTYLKYFGKIFYWVDE